MKLGIVFLTLTFGVVSLSLWSVTTASPVAAAPRLAVAPGLVVPLGDEQKRGYVGSGKCKKCHMAQYKSWSKTKMAGALSILKPGKRAEAKRKAGLDADKDYTKDETCLKCHSVGFGEKSGYAVPDPSDKRATKAAAKLAGVGCESCHGAGGDYVHLHDEIMKSKRAYTQEEMFAKGLVKIDASTCTACHNEKSPTYDASKPFDFEKEKNEDAHEHKEPKQRS